MTKEYALASGYAEMYERFCNKMFCLGNPFFNKFYNKKYIFHNDVKFLSFNDLLTSKKIKNFISTFNNDINIIENYYNTIFDNQYISDKYINLYDENDVKYLDSRILNIITHSSGMAAGNTLEEALNQGISELCEHHVLNNFFKNIQDKYYFIDIKEIKDKNILNTISNIEKNNNKLYIIDLSYNFNVPVIMTILINYYNSTLSINFGSSPVFEIAIERTLTEIYQNIKTYNNINKDIIPFKDTNWDLMQILFYGNIAYSTSFNEDFFNKLNINSKPNKNIFLFKNNKNYSNNDFLIYYKELFKKLNIKIYYKNNSLIKNMYAIKIYSEDLIGFETMQNSINKIDNFEKTNIIYTLKELYNIINNYIINKTIDLNKLKYILQKYIYFYSNENNIFFIKTLSFNSWFFAYDTPIDLNHIVYDILSNFNDLSLNTLINEHIYEWNNNLYMLLKKYIILNIYLKSKKYSIEEIKKYLKYLKIYISDEDIFNINNEDFLINKIILEPLYNQYKDKNYNIFLNYYL